MKYLRSTLGAILLASCASTHAASPIPSDSHQLIVVTASAWDSMTGTMRRYERNADNGPWVPVNEVSAFDIDGNEIPASITEPIVVGRNGLGWGLGLHSDLEFLPEPGEPIKQEGDGKAPAGVFSLGTAFGITPILPSLPLNLSYPYVQATDTLRCVDDMNSPYYNELVDTRELNLAEGEALPWPSDEGILRTDGLYSVGIVVNHNVSPAVMGMGSCIFMHIWRGADRGTAGCTAMAVPTIIATTAWLRAAAKPTLVQLPQAQYDVLKTAWELPWEPRDI